MCVIKLCSVLYGVPIEPSCHNKIHWCVAFRCDHLCDKQMPPLSGINYSRVITVDKTRHASSYRSQSQVLVKNSDFWPNYGGTVWITPQQLVWKMEKLEWRMKWWRSLRTDYLHKTNMTDRQTDTAWCNRPCLSIALSGKYGASCTSVWVCVCTRTRLWCKATNVTLMYSRSCDCATRPSAFCLQCKFAQLKPGLTGNW